jgi:hypothetical protein
MASGAGSQAYIVCIHGRYGQTHTRLLRVPNFGQAICRFGHIERCMAGEGREPGIEHVKRGISGGEPSENAPFGKVAGQHAFP